VGSPPRPSADDSPAAHAGIAPGDVVTKVNGQPVTSARDAMVLTFGKAGSTVELVVNNDGATAR